MPINPKLGPYSACRMAKILDATSTINILSTLGGRSRCVLKCRELRGRFGVPREFPSRRSVMRRTIAALTAIFFLAPTEVMAMTSAREPVRDSESGSEGVAIHPIYTGGYDRIIHRRELVSNVLI